MKIKFLNYNYGIKSYTQCKCSSAIAILYCMRMRAHKLVLFSTKKSIFDLDNQKKIRLL